MIKGIIVFTIACAGLSVIQMVIPLFGRNGRAWREQSYKQRFCNMFFPVVIAFIILAIDDEYRTSHSPGLNDRIIMEGAEYCLVTDLEEIDGADYAYDIVKEASDEETCRIIAHICRDLKKGSDRLYVRPEGGRFRMIDQGKVIGEADTSIKKYTRLLKIYYY